MTASKDFPVGRISGVFGLRGELKCDPTSAGRTCFFPGARLDVVLAPTRAQREEVTVKTLREHKGRLLVTFEGVPDATAAERYSGSTLYANRADLDVGEDEYLDVDLVGCVVRSRDGKDYGTVDRVEHYPASDMLIVAGRMLPMVRAFIVAIDMATRTIVVDVPPGLLDDDAEEAR